MRDQILIDRLTQLHESRFANSVQMLVCSGCGEVWPCRTIRIITDRTMEQAREEADLDAASHISNEAVEHVTAAAAEYLQYAEACRELHQTPLSYRDWYKTRDWTRGEKP